MNSFEGVSMRSPGFDVNDWQEDLRVWLEPFFTALGGSEQRYWAPVYLQGLLGLGGARASSRWPSESASGRRSSSSTSSAAYQQLKDEPGLDHFEWLLLAGAAPSRAAGHDGIRLASAPPPAASWAVGGKTKAGSAGATLAAVTSRNTAGSHRVALSRHLPPLPPLRHLRQHVPA